MGADLCIACISCKPSVDLHRAQKAMLKCLKKRGGISNEEKEAIENDGSYDDFDTYAAECAINTFFGSLGNRDVTDLVYPERTIFITGGMSWGDDPTESFDAFNAFNLLPDDILRAGGFGCNGDLIDIFLEEYGNKISDKMAKQLKSLKVADAL
jgi:hypothetical protein